LNRQDAKRNNTKFNQERTAKAAKHAKKTKTKIKSKNQSNRRDAERGEME